MFLNKIKKPWHFSIDLELFGLILNLGFLRVENFVKILEQF